MQRLPLFAAIVVVLSVLALPTAATALGGQDETERLVLEPADDEYAQVVDGELEATPVAVGTNTITRTDEVFSVTATQATELTVVHEDPGITFYPDGDPSERLTEDEGVALEAGERLVVGVEIDTTGGVDDEAPFRILVPGANETPAGTQPGPGPGTPAELRVTGASLDRTEVVPGEPVTVTATVEREGEGAVSGTVPLAVDGVAVAQQSVAVAADPETITFERSFQQPGEHEVAVGDEPAGTVTVLEPDEGPVFSVTDASLSAEEIEPGQSVVVTATVTNEGTEPGTFTADLHVDEVVRADRPVELDPGESATVTFTRSFDATGTYDVGISNVDAGQLRVGLGSGSSIRSLVDSSTGMVASVAGPTLTLGLFLFVRRRDDD